MPVFRAWRDTYRQYYKSKSPKSHSSLEIRQCKKNSIQSKKIQFCNCRSFSSPIRREKKRGNFTTDFCDWMDPFLYSLSSKNRSFWCKLVKEFVAPLTIHLTRSNLSIIYSIINISLEIMILVNFQAKWPRNGFPKEPLKIEFCRILIE